MRGNETTFIYPLHSARIRSIFACVSWTFSCNKPRADGRAGFRQMCMSLYATPLLIISRFWVAFEIWVKPKITGDPPQEAMYLGCRANVSALIRNSEWAKPLKELSLVPFANDRNLLSFASILCGSSRVRLHPRMGTKFPFFDSSSM